MSENHPTIKELATQEASELTNAVVRKASALSISIAVVMVAAAGCVGAFLYFNKETVIRLFEVGHEVEHLQAAHDHCHTELSLVKMEVSELREEVRGLKQKLNIAVIQ